MIETIHGTFEFVYGYDEEGERFILLVEVEP